MSPSWVTDIKYLIVLPCCDECGEIKATMLLISVKLKSFGIDIQFFQASRREEKVHGTLSSFGCFALGCPMSLSSSLLFGVSKQMPLLFVSPGGYFSIQARIPKSHPDTVAFGKLIRSTQYSFSQFWIACVYRQSTYFEASGA